MDQLKLVTLRQVEYGKFFTNRGATDFSILAYTEGMQSQLEQLNKALNYPTQSEFDAVRPGTVSAAMVKARAENEVLFVHIQRRRENEKSPGAPLSRPYNQIRYTLLTHEELRILFSAGIAVYYDLLTDSLEQSPFPPYQLRDYFSENTAFGEPQQLRPLQFKTAPPAPPSRSLLYEYTPGREITIIQTIAQSIIGSIVKKRSVQFSSYKLEFLDKLLITQAVQRLVYPFKGWVTFDLHHAVVGREVDLKFIPENSDNKRKIGTYVSWACQKFADRKLWFLVNQVFFDEDFGWLLRQVGDDLPLEQLEQFFGWISNKENYDSVQAILDFCFQQQANQGKDVAIKIVSFFREQPQEIQEQLLQSKLSLDLLHATALTTPWTEWFKYFFGVRDLRYSQHLSLFLQRVSLNSPAHAEVSAGKRRLEELISVPRYREALEDLLRQTVHSPILSTLSTEREYECFFELFNLLYIPIPIIELQVALSRFEQFSKYLPQVAAYNGMYVDLPGEDALSWLQQVAQARQRSQYVIKDPEGKLLDTLYAICRGIATPGVELIGRMLVEVLTLPLETYNHLKELEYWLDRLCQIPESRLTAYPQLAFLTGYIGTGIESYWEAARKINQNGNLINLFLLLLELVSENSQKHLRKELAFEDTWQLVQLTQNGEGKAQYILRRAIKENLITSDFVQRLITHPDRVGRRDALSLLAHIVTEADWRPLLLSLPQETLVRWLSLVSPESRSRYDTSGRDALYDLASLVYRDWPPLLSSLIDNVAYLPEPPYTREEEYRNWLNSLEQIAERRGLEGLPGNLRFLLGERNYNEPRYGDNIPILYHFSLLRLLKQTPGNIPNEDAYQLFAYCYNSGQDVAQRREFQALRDEAIKRGLIPVEFINYLSKKAASRLPTIAFEPEWEPYRQLLNVEQTIALVNEIGSATYLQKVYYLLESKFLQMSSDSLVWRIAQMLPDLPESPDEKSKLFREWVEKARGLKHLTGPLFQFTQSYNKDSPTFRERTRQAQNPDGLFLLAITDWFGQQAQQLTPQIPLRVEDVSHLATMQRVDLLQRGYENGFVVFDEQVMRRLVRIPGESNNFAQTLYEFYQNVLKTSVKPASDELLWCVLRYLLPFFSQQDILSEAQAQNEYASWIDVVRQRLMQRNKARTVREESDFIKNLEMLSHPEDTNLFAISNAGSDPLGRVFFIMAFQYLDRQGFVELSEQDRQAYQKIVKQDRIPILSPAGKRNNRSPLLFIVPGTVMMAAMVVALVLLLSRLGFPIPFFSNPLATTVQSLVLGIEPTVTPTPIPPATPTLLPTPTITTTPTPTSTPTITVTSSPTALPTMQGCEFLIDKDPFVIEAEHFFSSSQGSGEWTNYLWQPMPAVNAPDIRGDVMQVVNSDPGQPEKQNEITDPLSSPRLAYRLFFKEEGKYYLYVRGKESDTNASIYISFDNTVLKDVHGQESFLTGFDDDKFKWQLLLQEINISSPGFHEIALHMREDGIIVDTLLLSTSPGEISSNDEYGLGPSPNTSPCRE